MPAQKLDPFRFRIYQEALKTVPDLEKQRLLVGFSGGPDSVFLALFLKDILGTQALELVYCNHQLRSTAEQTQELHFVKTFAKQGGFSVSLQTLNVRLFAQQTHQSIEAAARELRYQQFTQIAIEKSCQIVVTAHHLDDHIETMLFQLFRGAKRGLSGISTLRPLNQNLLLWRPLLSISKSDLRNYLDSKKQAYSIDSSNESLEFTRNKIRKELIPLIEQINPNYKDVLSTYVCYAKDMAHYCESNTEHYLLHLEEFTQGHRIRLEILLSLSPIEQSFLLYQIWDLITQNQFRPSSIQTQAILSSIQEKGASKTISISKDFQVKINHDYLSFTQIK